MDPGIGIAIKLIVGLFTLPAQQEPRDGASSPCQNPQAYEQSSRPGETAPAVHAECKDEAKVEGNR